MKTKKIIILSFFSLVLIFLANFALEFKPKSIEDCNKTNISDFMERERCIEQFAQSTEDCQKILDKNDRKKCYNKFIDYVDEEEECQDYPEELREECYANAIVNKYPDQIEKCYDLVYMYQKGCVRNFVQIKNITDPNFCRDVKEDFQKICAKQAVRNHYPVFALKKDVDASICEQYEGNIKEGCLSHFESVGSEKVLVAGFFGIMLLWFFGPAIFLIILAVIIIIIIKKIKKRNNKDASH